MEDYSPLRINTYTIDELLGFINEGKTTYDNMCKDGLLLDKRDELSRMLDKARKEDELWNNVIAENTISAYEYYKKMYPNGKYVLRADIKINELGIIFDNLKEELFDEMICRPWIYIQPIMSMLLKGKEDYLNSLSEPQREAVMKDLRNPLYNSSEAMRFINSGMKITIKDLYEREIIPETFTERTLLDPEYDLVARKADELGDFPADRTDIYFVGMPRSGKTAILASLMYQLHQDGREYKGIYQPQFNNDKLDLCRDYYHGLIRSIDRNKFGQSTADETVSYIKIDLEHGRKKTPVTFVEISGEAINKASKAHVDGAIYDVWKDLGASKCLSGGNGKLLLFLVDYSCVCGNVRNDDITQLDQLLILESVLSLFAHDGKGRENSIGCTMSKVDTLAIIVTKYDLIEGHNKEEKRKNAYAYADRNLGAFIHDLHKKCKEHNINKHHGFMPYILTFSVGRLNIGNSLMFDPEDANNLLKFISETCTDGGTGFFQKILG